MRVLIIVANGLQLGYLGCYGNEWVLTPTLDRLAAEGIVFDRHYSDCPDPIRARNSWRTGCYQIPVPGSESVAHHLISSRQDLIKTLTDNAVGTTLVIENNNPITTDFAPFWKTVEGVEIANDDKTTDIDRAIKQAVTILKKMPKREKGLIWLDWTTLLPEWKLPNEYQEFYFREDSDEKEKNGMEEEEPSEGEASLAPWIGPLPKRLEGDDDTTFIRLQRTYAGAVTYLDQNLAILLEELEVEGLLEEMTIVVTTDSGLVLGEHGVVAADVQGLHEERVHLPLIIRLPQKAEAGRRVATLTQPVDLMPTILEIFGLQGPQVHGHSLLPLCHGKAKTVREYACSGSARGKTVEWSLRTTDWAFLLPLDETAGCGPQLYIKPEDRWEVNNIIQHHPEWAQHLEETLRKFVDAARLPGPLLPPPLGEYSATRSEPEA
ncbi:MAG TPA: sulfatase-like hydrolase/transferase [Gemmataceae bacterium]|nr:sulfatase-like hydrolase/transferase [Gemmataceae bacterium]